MLVTNQTTRDYWFGPLHLPAGIGQTLTVDDTSETSLYLLDDAVANAINTLYAAGMITVSGAAAAFPRAIDTPTLLWGVGTPEATVFAPQGSAYLRRDGMPVNGGVLYLKTTGCEVSTGWVSQDGWHNVGDPGEPAFQNGWTNAGGGLTVMRFRLVTGTPVSGDTLDDTNSSLELQGSVTGGPVGTTVFTLPDGFRPAAEMRLPCVDDAGTVFYFRVLATGDVLFETADVVAASGIQQLTSSDGTVTITNPGGPIADLSAAAAAGGIVKLAEVVLAANAASIDLPSISGSHTVLFVYLLARGDTAASTVNVNMTINGDTSSHYADNVVYTGGGTSPNAAEDNNNSQVGCGNMPAASAPAGWACIWDILIPLYAGTTFYKVGQMRRYYRTDLAGSSGRIEAAGEGFAWASTAAINRITFTPVSGNFVAGSHAIVYGM